MANLRRGDFNKRVIFQNPTKTPDGAGGHTESYATFLETWAHVMSRGGQRNFSEGLDRIIDRKDIFVYSRQLLTDNLSLDTRIIYNGKEYAIDTFNFVDEIKHIIKIETTGD